MRKSIKILLSFILSAAVILSTASGVFALDSTPDSAARTIVVTKAQIERNTFSDAVQSALDTARDTAAADAPVTVKVEAGEYLQERILRIYSNTTLSLYDVVIKRTKDSRINMLRTGTDDPYDSGPTGYFYKNIAIEGGEFDADLTLGTMIKVAHAEKFSMTDVTLRNPLDSHMMEVAGVDGFTLRNCVFKDMINDTDDPKEACYEAVQLDILKKGHIVGCRSEDISMKNILVEGCKFESCPRGVGSHTSVMNNPFTDIVIRNNSFIDMGSAAIQETYWENCSITGNYIENTPRGIAVYATGNDGKGMFLSSVIAAEGNTESHVSDDYTPPKNSNTLIAENIIKKCGDVKDVYANYGVSAISAIGYDLAQVYPFDSNGGAGLPKGEYYVNGVTVKHNYIEVKGTACRINEAKNIDISSNVFICDENTSYPDTSYYGVVGRYNSEFSKIDNNYIKNAKISGIHLAETCKAVSVTNNLVDTVSKFGVSVYNSPVDNISCNKIVNAKNSGIALKDGMTVKNPIYGNKIYACPVGIVISDNSKASLNSNTFNSCTNVLKYSKLALLTNLNIGNNYSAVQPSAVFNDVSALEMSEGAGYKLKTGIAPLNADCALSYSSSDSETVSVTAQGYINALKEGTAVITVKTSNGKTASVNVTVKSGREDIKTTAASPVSMVNSLYNNNKSVVIKWGKVAGAVKYRVFKKTTTQFVQIAETAALSHVDTRLATGLTYSYTVRALDSNGKYIGSYDTVGGRITYVDSASVSRLVNNSKDISIQYNAVKGASNYRLFYREKNAPWKMLGATGKTSKSLSPVVSGQLYRVLIVSCDSNKNPVNFFSKTGKVGKFLSAAKLSKIKVKKTKFKLSWSKVAGAKKYVVYAKSDKKKSKWKAVKTTAKNSLVYKAKLKRKYEFKVLSKSGSNYSVFSNIKKAKAKIKKKS